MGCAESDLRRKEFESELAKEEDEEMSWVQRLLRTYSNHGTTRRQKVVATIPPDPRIMKTITLKVGVADAFVPLCSHFFLPHLRTKYSPFHS